MSRRAVVALTLACLLGCPGNRVDPQTAARIQACLAAAQGPSFHDHDLSWAAAQPATIQPLVLAFLADARPLRLPTEVLKFMPADAWPAVLAGAFARLAEDPRQPTAQAAVWAAQSLAPAALAPHLKRTFQQPGGPWRGNVYHNEFRGAAPEVLDFLFEVARDPRDSRRDVAAQCIVQSQDLGAITRLLADADDDLAHLALEFGFEKGPKGVRRLFPASVYEVVPEAAALAEPPDPRFHLPPDPSRGTELRGGRLGGVAAASCKLCREPLHRFLRLDQVPPGLGVSGMPALELATCLSCLHWQRDVIYFHHDAAGRPTVLSDEGRPVVPRQPLPPLKEAAFTLVSWGTPPVPEQKATFRLGGAPAFVQHAADFACPTCHQRMTFLLEVPDGLKLRTGETWTFGGGGDCYVFWCDACKVSATYGQDS